MFSSAGSAPINTPTLKPLHPTVTSWPFEAWGVDIVGPISPLSSKGHRFILVITDYFSKWARVVLLTEIKNTNMANFIKHHIIHQFGVSRRIIHDNGPQFVSQAIFQFRDKCQI